MKKITFRDYNAARAKNKALDLVNGGIKGKTFALS